MNKKEVFLTLCTAIQDFELKFISRVFHNSNLCIIYCKYFNGLFGIIEPDLAGSMFNF